MQQAKQGDKVQVHYTGTLDDGEVFDSSEGREPLAFTIGSGNLILGFEEAVVGMAPGESKRETIEPERAYGGRRDDLVMKVDRVQILDVNVRVGDVVRISFPDGRTAPVIVTEIDKQYVTLDANHPLAGKTLTFDLTLVAIDSGELPSS